MANVDLYLTKIQRKWQHQRNSNSKIILKNKIHVYHYYKIKRVKVKKGFKQIAEEK